MLQLLREIFAFWWMINTANINAMCIILPANTTLAIRSAYFQQIGSLRLFMKKQMFRYSLGKLFIRWNNHSMRF